uniref:MATH domain-containing protein n=2 Tax=Triticum urartu TaxID=4572 RepID=A0A8R7P421_TRIUA
MYCGSKASYNFDDKNMYSNKECLISLQELLKSSAFLVDDSCVFGVDILKIDVSSPEKKSVVVQKKATTVENLFVQKKGFIKGTYTWTMNNFLELESQQFVRSPTFEVGGHRWHIGMYPHGDKRSTDYLSMALCLDSSDELFIESRKVVQITLSILDQKSGKYFTRTTGSALPRNCQEGWAWYNFLPLKKLKDMSRGYLIESKCVLKADLTIFGSSNDG